MKIEKIQEDLENAYYSIMKDDIKRIQSYKYKAWLSSVIFIWLYFYFDYLFFLIIWIFIFISILANFYKYLWFKEWFKNWYLAEKGIDLYEYEEKVLDNF